MSSALTNELILASAGSGKTWQLTNRFIAIMAQQHLAGVDIRPERIIAITFTRKAAGEFFDSIITKLATASLNDVEASKLAKASSYPILGKLKAKDYLFLLDSFVSRIPRLFLGTLDSFFSQILRSFPSEFGLPNTFEMLSDANLLIQRERIYQQLFETLDEDKTNEFLGSFRRAVAGQQKASIQGNFDQYIREHHDIFLSGASQELWGNPATIWPEECPWILEKNNLQQDLEELLSYFQQSDIKEKQLLFWVEFAENLKEHTAGTAFTDRIKFFLTKFSTFWNEIKSGDATFPVNRLKQTFDAKECELIERITASILGGEFMARAVKTQGFWELLHLYEQEYGTNIRRQGKLTFKDLEIILNGTDLSTSIPLLSQIPNEEARLQIDYRLDSQFDHWLLDEFQDTSFLQWSVLENLIDEAVQDSSGERSFFLVGDIKQAIYSWRGGDTKLFNDIYERYRGSDSRSLQKGQLNTSWRSGNDVIQPVNAIFSDHAALNTLSLPAETIEKWQWQKHEVAPPHEKQEGFTAIYGVDKDYEGNEAKFHTTLELLKKIQPTQRNLSCVILVQKNDFGHQLVDYVRQHSDIPISSEADVSIAIDNPVTISLLSILHWMAHPNDNYAWQHLLMTPMRETLLQKDRAAIRDELVSQLHENGFEQCIRHITDSLLLGINLDTFSEGRIEELLRVAQNIDQTGSRNIEEFLILAEHHKTRELTSSSSVQVMTIHKAKGLTFDCAILPELGGNKLTSLRTNMGVKRKDHTRETEWVYDLPATAISQLDPTLSAYIESKEAESAYEALCKFYVALTRARFANYMIIDRKPSSRSKNFEALLLDVLSEEDPNSKIIGDSEVPAYFESHYPTSNESWFLNHEIQHEAPHPEKTTENPSSKLPQQRLKRWTSNTDKKIKKSEPVYNEGYSSLKLGTLIHQMLECVDWLDDADVTKLWEPFKKDPLYDTAYKQLHLSFQNPEIIALFKKTNPKNNITLWKEQNFEVLLNNTWASGTFDRVALLKNDSEEVEHCQLIDFKTTPKKELPQEIFEQMKLYKLALEQMFPNALIESHVLLTRQNKIVTL